MRTLHMKDLKLGDWVKKEDWKNIPENGYQVVRIEQSNPLKIGLGIVNDPYIATYSEDLDPIWILLKRKGRKVYKRKQSNYRRIVL